MCFIVVQLCNLVNSVKNFSEHYEIVFKDNDREVRNRIEILNDGTRGVTNLTSILSCSCQNNISRELMKNSNLMINESNLESTS